MISNPKELAHAPITEVADLIKKKEASPVEVVDLILSRISELDPTINAYIHVFEDESRAAAKAAEAEIASGSYRGPLHGIPISIKDIYESGPTTCGSPSLLGYVAEEDCQSVVNLKRAGAIVVGKAGTYEFAYGPPTLETHFPPTRNAWNQEFECGGSSSGTGGSIAAGLAYAGMGSCTGGSIRWPAQCCGHVGLKATYGRVSRRGVYPLSWSLDHTGPLARTVADAGHMLRGCAGYDPLDQASANVPVTDFNAKLGRDIKGMKIGLLRTIYEDNYAPGVKSAFDPAVQVFEKLGAEIVDIPTINLRQLIAIEFPSMWADAAAIHHRNLRTGGGDKYGRHTRGYMLWGLLMDSTAYLNSLRARAQVRDQLLDALTTKVDALLLPTVGFQTPRVLESDPGLGFLGGEFSFYTPIFNFTGLPAVSVPCGFDQDHMPVGLQIAGKPFDEATMLQVAYAYEQATEWHTMHPDI